MLLCKGGFEKGGVWLNPRLEPVTVSGFGGGEGVLSRKNKKTPTISQKKKCPVVRLGGRRELGV